MQIIAGRALVSDLGTRCTIGATGYDDAGTPHILTAGHAGGTEWYWHGGRLGTTATKRYRPLDIRSIRAEAGEITPLVDPHEGWPLEIIGFQEPSVGLRVIRIGAKSRWTPGVVTHVHQTQCFDLGQCLEGLFRTNIASGKGDSGGPIITDPVDHTVRLVGFTSGGWYGGRKPPVTLAQPAREAFDALGLKISSGRC